MVPTGCCHPQRMSRSFPCRHGGLVLPCFQSSGRHGGSRDLAQQLCYTCFLFPSAPPLVGGSCSKTHRHIPRFYWANVVGLFRSRLVIASYANQLGGYTREVARCPAVLGLGPRSFLGCARGGLASGNFVKNSKQNNPKTQSTSKTTSLELSSRSISGRCILYFPSVFFSSCLKRHTWAVETSEWWQPPTRPQS